MAEKTEKIIKELTKLRRRIAPKPFRLHFISLEPAGNIYEAEMQPQLFDRLVRVRRLDTCEVLDKGVFTIIETPICPIVVWRGNRPPKPPKPAGLHFARRVSGGGRDG